MRTVTLPGGSGGGSKKLILSRDVRIRMFDVESEDGVDGIVELDPNKFLDQQNKTWDDGYVKGKIKGYAEGRSSLFIWQLSSVMFGLLFAIFSIAYHAK